MPQTSLIRTAGGVVLDLLAHPRTCTVTVDWSPKVQPEVLHELGRLNAARVSHQVGQQVESRVVSDSSAPSRVMNAAAVSSDRPGSGPVGRRDSRLGATPTRSEG